MNAASQTRPLVVPIGMLACNEADSIGKTIESLLSQSVFSDSASSAAVSEWEIIVVPNGCADDSARVANEVLQSKLSPISDAQVNYSVRAFFLASRHRMAPRVSQAAGRAVRRCARHSHILARQSQAAQRTLLGVLPSIIETTSHTRYNE